MNQTANRYRNIISAIDNLLIQLDHREDSWIKNLLESWRNYYEVEMGYQNKMEYENCRNLTEEEKKEHEIILKWHKFT